MALFCYYFSDAIARSRANPQSVIDKQLARPTTAAGLTRLPAVDTILTDLPERWPSG
jgi:hypothetical protein